MTESINATASISQNLLSELTSDSSSSTTQTTDEIIRDIKQNSTLSNVTAQDIIDDYGVTMSEAQEILEKIEESENNTTPDYSSFSVEV